MTTLSTIAASMPRDVPEAKAASRVLPHTMVSRGSKTGELTPAQQFEGFVLQSFVEHMLPKEDSTYFGEGTAGAIWRSMLAERIGAEMAESGGIGVAEMIEKRDAQGGTVAKAKAALERDAAAAQGAALSKPGAL